MNTKKIFILIIFFILYFGKVSAQEESVYDKIDLFGEVLDKINKEYVEEVDQSDTMDAAINGVLQSLDPYSSYMSPKNLEEMQTETIVSVCISSKFFGDIYDEYGSNDCKTPLIAASIVSDWSTSSTYSLFILSKTSPKRSILS